MKAYVLFDLDGTLTDPGLGITNSVVYALNRFGITETDIQRLYKFIGPPLWASFEQYYGFTKAQANTAVEYYREYYRDRGIYENAVYDGIEDLLKTLSAAGRTLVVATSKPTVFANQVLSHFGLDSYFAFVSGSELDGTRVNKDEVIAYALEQCGIEPSRAVMVGDREHDMAGAKKNSVTAIGVLYGYGKKADLNEAGADYIAKDVNGLKNILLDGGL